MSISNRVWIIGCVLAGTFMLSALGGYIVLSQLVAAQKQTAITASALRNHVEGDMMHDALRGHVSAALFAASRGDHAQGQAVREEQAEHSAWFRRVMDANRKLPLKPAVREALAALDEPLRVYIAESTEITRMAGRDPERAARRLPAFTTEFKNLERVMEETSDRLEEATEAESAQVARWQTIWTIVLMLSTFAGLGVAGWVTLMLRKDIVAPVAEITDGLARLSEGQLDVEVKHVSRGDEIGALAQGVLAFKSAVEDVKRSESGRLEVETKLQSERDAARTAADERRRDELNAMAVALEQKVLTTVQQVSNAAQSLQAVSGQLKASVTGTHGDIVAAVGATDEAASNVSIVGSAAEEMAMSVAEISTRTDATAKIAGVMAERAGAATATIEGLEIAMDHISNVSDLISSIAQRTNMLALNATIEAARAGDAGKGFSVVASEIKNLAARTTEATAEIAEQLASVKDSATRVANSLSGMAEAVNDVEVATTSISTAIQQQSAATDEISSSIERTVVSTEELRLNMGGLRTRADETNEVAAVVANAATGLEADAVALRSEVVQFIASIRAA